MHARREQGCPPAPAAHVAAHHHCGLVWSPPGCAVQAMLVTFFGGSWTTPVDTHIDFANFSLTVLE